MKRSDKRKLKLCVLRKIKSSKHVLFGQFSSTLSKNMKKEEWEKICSFAKSIGVLDSNRDWTYLRDVWWPNVKKGMSDKIDNTKKTDSTFDGKDYVLDDLDEMIIDIIGSDSPVIEKLDVDESNILEPVLSLSETADNEGYGDLVTIEESHNEVEEEQTEAVTSKGRRISKYKVKEMKKQHDTKIELQIELLKANLYQRQLECRKLELELSEVKKQHDAKKELQNQLFKAELYHHQLECRKLELELGIQKSIITHDINETVSYSFES